MNGFTWKTVVLASVVATSGCATSPGPASGPAGQNFAEWPCLSYTLPCGKIPTRKPETKQLAGPLNGDPARGKIVANERGKGNCIACHRMREGDQPGTRGPDLTRYGELGRNDADIYRMIYDMRTRVPDTVMPPIGTNGVLTDQEIRDIVAYLQTSK